MAEAVVLARGGGGGGGGPATPPTHSHAAAGAGKPPTPATWAVLEVVLPGDAPQYMAAADCIIQFLRPLSDQLCIFQKVVLVLFKGEKPRPGPGPDTE
jgi:hypothetical protein